MSEITDITTILRGWEKDILTGNDALNNSVMAVLEKRHALDRAATEIACLRESNEILAMHVLSQCNPTHWQGLDDCCKRKACVLARKVLGLY